MKKIKSIAILTSGGDSPGMNAAIRACVRTALAQKMQVWGIKKGYQGLIENDLFLMNASSVGNTLQKGGTFLQTSRCPEFHQKKYRSLAFKNLQEKNIDGLVVIGGDGSFRGAYQLFQETKFPIVGIPGTIDNDILGTDYTIGFDTAVQTAMEAVDKVRDTAMSHERTFFIEVMGRNSPAIALRVGICTGAESIILPHENIDYKNIMQNITRGINRGKTCSIIIVAEGNEEGRTYKISQEFFKRFGHESRVCVLGHIQRGGVPTPTDRFMASRMGYLAVQAFLQNKISTITSFSQGKIQLTPLKNSLKNKSIYSDFAQLKNMMEVLSI